MKSRALAWPVLIACMLGGITGCTRHAVTLDAGAFPEPARDAITFWGHACVYIDVDGYGIVTDPVFDGSIGLVMTRRIPAPPPAAYAGTRVILISHPHKDHLSTATLATFPRDAVILCPEPSTKYLENLGMAVRAMAPGDSFEYPGGRIVAVPAHHPGGRYSLDAEADGRALGYVIYTPESTIYWSGDTDYFEGMNSIGRRHRPDVALLDINGHLNSTDVLRAMSALRVTRVVPLHHGAYRALFFPGSERWHDEVRRLLGSMFVPIGVGESVSLTGWGAPRGPGRAVAGVRGVE